MHFRGRERHTMDAKGRTALPVRFRRIMELGAGPGEEGAPLEVVLVSWFPGCVRVYPLSTWRAYEERCDEVLSEEDPLGLDEEASNLRRLMFGSTHDVTLDAHGRVLVPLDCRESAGLEREVIWMGLGAYLEIWSPDRIRTHMGPATMQQIQKRFAGRRQSEGA